VKYKYPKNDKSLNDFIKEDLGELKIYVPGGLPYLDTCGSKIEGRELSGTY